MDYDFIKRHRAKFSEKVKSIYPYNDEKVLAAYDASLVEAILDTSEDRMKAYDKAMDHIYDAMSKNPKGEKE